MKNFLSFLCVVLIVAACSATNKSYKNKSTVSASQTDASHMPSWEATEFDDIWETDYMKFDINSNWIKYESEIDDYSRSVSFSWITENGDNYINFQSNIDSSYHKLYQNELKDYCIEQEHIPSEKIIDTFSKNGIAYIIIKSGGTGARTIEFFNDGLYGCFEYNIESEDVVTAIIDTIMFY